MSSIAPTLQRKIRTLIPPWLQGKWGNLGIFFILYILLNLAWTQFHWGGPQRVSLIANLLSFTPSILATIFAWHVTRQKSLDVQVRQAWFILGLSFFMFLLGNLIWAYLELVAKVDPFPSLADVFYLAFYPLALWGLLLFPSAAHNRRASLALSLDLLSVLTAATMFVGYFVIIPTATAGNDLALQLLGAAYPVGSLMVIGGILAVLYRQPSQNTQSTLSYLLIGMLFFVGGDIAFGYTSLAGTYAVGNWTDASWNVAQLFFAMAALRNLYRGAPSRLGQSLTSLWNRLIRWLPFLAIAMGYGLVAYVVIVEGGRAAEWLMADVLLLTLMVIARQIISPAFNDLPIRSKIILTLIMVSVLSISLVSATAYLTVRSNLEDVVGERLKAEVEVRSHALGNEVKQQLDLVEGFVLDETIQQQIVDANDKADATPFAQHALNQQLTQDLYEFCRNFPTHSTLMLTDQYGGIIAATAQQEMYSQAGETWWQAVYNYGRGAVYVSEPNRNPKDQSLGIIIAIPVHANHSQEVIGVLRTTYHIQNIMDTFAIPDHEAKQGFDLLLPDGNLLNQDGSIIRLDPATISQLQSSRDTNYAELVFEGSLQLVSQAPVTTSSKEKSALPNLNWTLIAHEDPDLAFAPLNTASRIALLTTLLVLFLTAGVALILAELVVAPISRLTGVAAQIAKGDLHTQANVEARDEIGTLANTFNSMLDTVSQTQQELKESETLYRNLIDYLPDMIMVHRDGKILLINPAGLKLLGAKNANELIGRSIFDMIPAEKREAIQGGIERVQITHEPTPLVQAVMHRFDGTVFDAELRAIPILYAGDPAIQLVARDITERKQAGEKIHELLAQVARQKGDLEIRVAERTAELNQLNQRLEMELIERQQLMLSLRDSEERFRLLFEASPDAIFLIDPHSSDPLWRIIDCNQAAGRMNGYTREELIGQSIDILNQKKSTHEEFTQVLENLRCQVVFRGMEVGHRHKDGHIFPIEYSTTLIKVGDRELVLGIDRDITERKQSEEALNQAKDAAEQAWRAAETANRAKSEFLSRMSHELRTPMNAILGFAQLLDISRKEPLTPNQKERIRQIVKGGQHLLDLINEILDISRIEANRLQISPEPVSIRESIQDALDLTIPLAIKRNIQIVTKLGKLDADPFVMADRQRLKQVLLNLLGNAVKYNYDAGSVVITCQQTTPDYWRISVIDTGPGISQKNLSRLFIPFERLNTDQMHVEGAGLGLVFAKRLVELMHGRIGVESMLGGGSTFWIELPATESPVTRVQRSGVTKELPSLSLDARTILYIEDNVANYELIEQVLLDYSQIKLLWAPDHKTGLELARQHVPNLILLDLHLGSQDGADVLRQLRADRKTASIPIVVVSADATFGQSERLKSLGAYQYLTKPLDVKQFVRLVEELLGEKEI